MKWFMEKPISLSLKFQNFGEFCNNKIVKKTRPETRIVVKTGHKNMHCTNLENLKNQNGGGGGLIKTMFLPRTTLSALSEAVCTPTAPSGLGLPPPTTG
jgi:hypothetical protein